MARKLVLIAAFLALVGAGWWYVGRGAEPRSGPITLRGVVLDVDGEPSRSHRLFARLTGDPDRPPALDDARLGFVVRGAFEWPVELPEATDDLWMVVGELGVEGCTSWARVRVPEIEGESAYVGTLKLEPPPLVASGVVVDTDGRPEHGVDLVFGDRNGFGGAMFRTSKGGEFELRGWSGPMTRIYGRKRAHFHEIAHVPRGSTTLRLPAPMGTLRLRARIDEGHFEERVRLRTWVELEDGRPGWSHTVTPNSGLDQTYELEPGRVHVEVGLYGREVVLWEETLDLAVDEDRDLEIDLRGLLHEFNFAIVDQRGRPIRHAIVYPTSDTKGAPSDSTWDDGRAAVLAYGASASIDVLVQAIGYRIRQLHGVTDETTIVLEPSLPVHVVIEDAPVLPAQRYRLGVHAVSLEAGLGGFCSASGVCRLDGPVELDLGMPAEGRWNLRWSLRHRTREGWKSLMLTTEPAIIEVDESDPERVVRVAAPVDAINDAVARLEGG